MIMPFIRLVAIYAVVILAGVAFFNRDSIAAMTDGMSIEWWPWSNSAPEAADAEPAESDSDTAPEQQSVAEVAPDRPTANSPIRMPVADPDPVAVSNPEAAQAADPETATAREPAIQMPVADAPEEESVAAVPSAQPEAPASAPLIQPEATAPVQAPAKPAAAPPVRPDPAARLAEARRAYWAGDIAGAQALYAALVRDLPDNADARGEYGNILYAQRRYPEAADAYLATGKLLIGDGKIAQVQPIIAVLDAIAPQKAASLRAMAADRAARN